MVFHVVAVHCFKNKDKLRTIHSMLLSHVNSVARRQLNCRSLLRAETRDGVAPSDVAGDAPPVGWSKSRIQVSLCLLLPRPLHQPFNPLLHPPHRQPPSICDSPSVAIWQRVVRRTSATFQLTLRSRAWWLRPDVELRQSPSQRDSHLSSPPRRARCASISPIPYFAPRRAR